jgi:hypothetical protein
MIRYKRVVHTLVHSDWSKSFTFPRSQADRKSMLCPKSSVSLEVLFHHDLKTAVSRDAAGRCRYSDLVGSWWRGYAGG